MSKSKGKKGAGAAPGYAARRLATEAVRRAIRERRTLEEALVLARPPRPLEPMDTALARAIATVTFRRMGTLKRVLRERLSSGETPDAGLLQEILLTGAAQVLFMETADHAAVDLAVDLAKTDKLAMHYAPLVNAVLRRIAAEKDAILAAEPAAGDLPAWMHDRWRRAYGEPVADAMGAALLVPPQVDVTVFGDAAAFAEQVGGQLLPTGSVRLPREARVDALPGYAEGAFQVQDAASALPARLLEAKPGMRILDLCAAPGGKTAQLAKAGAQVVAVERSRERAARLEANLARLLLDVEIVIGDANTYQGALFDAVLLDAPCSATGTLRRHPEIAWTRTLEDILKLAEQQKRLLDHAASLVKPGGLLVYSTCSLEPEEGEKQIEALLSRHDTMQLEPVDLSLLGIEPEAGSGEGWTRQGCLRSLPQHLAGSGGVDGFFAARLRRLR